MRRVFHVPTTFGFLGATLFLAACGGGSGGGTIPAAGTSASNPSQATSGLSTVVGGLTSDDRSVESLGTPVVNLKCNHGPPLHGPCAESASIPTTGGYGGTISLPSGSGSITITSSTVNRTYAPQLRATPLLYVTVKAGAAVVLNGIPGFALSLPASVSGSLNVAERGTGQWTKVEGPVTVANAMATFAPVPGTITLAAGQSASYALYGGSVVQPSPSPSPAHTASPTPAHSASPSPRPSPTHPPAPSPRPSPTPTPAPDVKGVIVDDITGQPIGGATVIVSENTLIVGSTPPPAGATRWPSTTTAADGSFDVKNVSPSTWTEDFSFIASGYPVYPVAQWLEVFSPDGHATYHGIWSIAASGTTNLASVGVAMPSTSDTAWLAQINVDRATVGIPAVQTTLAFDSVTLESARYWAQQMASYGFYDHQCPSADTSCQGFWLWQTQHHSAPSSQNIDYGYPGWTDLIAEGLFMAEIQNCPSSNWITCPYAENTGHYINIMTATFWAGVGTATGKDPGTQMGSTDLYYVENFTNPKAETLSNIQSIRRSMMIHGPRNGGIGP